MVKSPNSKILLAAILLLMVSTTRMISAQNSEFVDVDVLGPQVGERVPDFELPDQNGQLQTLDSIMGPNGAMLLFHRSADW